ncbi:aldehyde dehydrogenase family protein [Citricoccus alkalitolerans]|uniref:Aldehyde dehydrogenase family protein n=1 Tax=Citricoccus alkalitolerans TaxID=246603 RepID=A0ABV8XTR2_9MICC
MNPATGQVLSEHPFATDEEAGQAVESAHATFREWRARDISDRAAVVRRIAELFEERTEELAQVITREMGKPIGESRGEAEFSAEIFRYYADHGPALAADQVLVSTDESTSVIKRRPLGVLLGIMPWNYPDLANDTQYGLGSAVFATEPGRAERLAEGLEAGMVGANQSPPETADMPFGGVKRSGYGRELGPLGMDEFVNKRLMAVAKTS